MISIDLHEYNYISADKRIPVEPVLKNIHLELCPGTVTSVLGPSGCGKSTLLRVLMGFEKTAYKSKNSFSLVPQTPHLFPWKTIFENIILGIYPLKMQLKQGGMDRSVKFSAQELKFRVTQILDIVGLAGTENKYPFEISVGMSQRVSFARAMINSFEALLLDEPFSALDALTRRELQNWLLKIIQEQKRYCLFVTHDISEAIYLSDNIYILSQKPATISAHFKKTNNAFIYINTGKIFSSENIQELEKTIFSLLC